jgi:hypothetical protein
MSSGHSVSEPSAPSRGWQYDRNSPLGNPLTLSLKNSEHYDDKRPPHKCGAGLGTYPKRKVPSPAGNEAVPEESSTLEFKAFP